LEVNERLDLAALGLDYYVDDDYHYKGFEP
jgi:hypothetical protein